VTAENERRAVHAFYNAGVISLDRVVLRRAGKLVLDQLTLGVPRGSIVVVHGGRGSGKTSLLAVAAGALRPDAGAVCIGGRDMMDLQPASLPYVRRNIGYLPPEPPLDRSETVIENVMLALAVRGAAVTRAQREALVVLTKLGLAAQAPQPAARLSEGSRRLLCAARALAGPPPVVVLDDPSVGLGPEDRDLLVAALDEARDAGAAVLVASTDETFSLALEDRGARRLRLMGGRIVGGPPQIALVEGGDSGEYDAVSPPDDLADADEGAHSGEPPLRRLRGP
jgi:ABC-type ATPase involved in cell division